MFLPDKEDIYTAPANESKVKACRKRDCGIKQAAVYLGRSLPSLLDEGCELSQTDASRSTWLSLRLPFIKRLAKKSLPATIAHHSGGQWQRWTLPELRQAAEEVALGLEQHLTIEKGDRAALLMASSVPFVMADIGCLLAQLVTVPIPPDQPVETWEYMLKETAASVLFVSQLAQVKPLLPKLSALPALRLIVVAEGTKGSSKHSSGDRLQNRLTTLQGSLPETIELMTLETLRQQTWSAAAAARLRAALHPQDLATIVYTLSASGRPLGAMLTHENLSGSALAAFSTLPCLRKGSSEVALSFLPLHHVFARVFVYGSLSYGQSLYFSSPRRVMTHLRELRPTVFFAVPRLLEKVYESWQAALQ
ncbi:MAG: AMP-binding protein, partial [Phormidesmis sp.]